MTLSVWMRGARPADGGLFIPAHPGPSACDLLLHPDGAWLRADDRTVYLPYEAYAAVGDDPWMYQPWVDSGGDAWILGGWAHTRGGGPIGVGVRAAGRFAAPIAELRKRRRTLANLVDRLADGSDVAPLYAARTINTWVDADRVALHVLCTTLARRPAWRRHLGNPTRTTQLLHDLADQDHAAIEPTTGLRRRTMETFLVMQRLGYQHRLHGRPLPDESRPDPDEVKNAVLRALTGNRYALPPDEADVHSLVHSHYLDVTPWPFTALLPEAPTTKH